MLDGEGRVLAVQEKSGERRRGCDAWAVCGLAAIVIGGYTVHVVEVK